MAHAVIIRLSRLRVRKAPRPQVRKPRGAAGHSWTSSSPPFSPPTPQECKMSWKYCLGTNTFSRDTLGGKGKSRSIRERWWWGVAMEKPLLVTKWPWSLGKCGPRRNLPFSRPKGRARGGKKRVTAGRQGRGESWTKVSGHSSTPRSTAGSGPQFLRL